MADNVLKLRFAFLCAPGGLGTIAHASIKIGKFQVWQEAVFSPDDFTAVALEFARCAEALWPGSGASARSLVRERSPKVAKPTRRGAHSRKR